MQTGRIHWIGNQGGGSILPAGEVDRSKAVPFWHSALCPRLAYGQHLRLMPVRYESKLTKRGLVATWIEPAE